MFEKVAIFELAVDGFQRPDRRARRAAHQRQRLRIMNIDFKPGQIVWLDRARDFDETVGALVEVEIEHHSGVGTNAVAERLQKLCDLTDEAVVRPPVEEARHQTKAGAEFAPARQQVARIGFQPLEAAIDHSAAELADIIERVKPREAPFVLEQIAPPDAPAAAMRPVEWNAIAERAAEQLIH